MLAVAAALAALQVANPCQDPAQALRCPDLVMARPSRLRAQRLPSGRLVLRMENRIVNVGAGPAEFFGERSGRRTMVARQVIADRAGVRRRYVTGADLYYTSVPERGGDYWKFDNAARFELWAQSPDGRRGAFLRIGPKLRYCLRDLRRPRGDLPRAPRRRVFPGCNQSPRKAEVTLGTSVGWADAYPASYPGNFVDIGGLPAGCYVVVQRVDPLQHVLELNEANNASATVVRLPFRPGPQRCPRYVPSP